MNIPETFPLFEVPKNNNSDCLLIPVSVLNDDGTLSNKSKLTEFCPIPVKDGTPGNDNLIGTLGQDILNGFDGDDIIIAKQGDDYLYGGNGNDILNGGKGSDQLTGGLGNDTLTGGAGSDSFTIGLGLGIKTISDFTNGQERIFLNGPVFEQLSISSVTNGTLIKVASTGEVLAVLTGVTPNLIGQEDFLVPTLLPGF
ncbi:hypothetical protein [Tychonema sp. BBK16]|uniref:hypothetical protein n=1 Tax=Tychonema sp. BBK16 TaxID=2699888 RepID=UPI001F2B6383|nr:hypothetical protein [Tychonema sp. BBK16]MCF6371505.1 hypothetical protein [Tychonema sp. BBK16]